VVFQFAGDGHIIPAAPFERGAVFVIVPQLGDAGFNLLTLGQRAEVIEGQFVLGVHPFPDLGGLTDVVFQPAIGVGDLDTEVVVCVFDLLCLGVIHRQCHPAQESNHCQA